VINSEPALITGAGVVVEESIVHVPLPRLVGWLVREYPVRAKPEGRVQVPLAVVHGVKARDFRAVTAGTLNVKAYVTLVSLIFELLIVSVRGVIDAADAVCARKI